MIKIAIDLSTTTSGLIVDRPGHKICVSTIELKPYSQENMYYNFKLIEKHIWTGLEKVDYDDDFPEDVLVGIEVSDFGNPNITQRFSVYSGVIQNYIYEIFGSDAKIKTFNANQWQALIGCKKNETRDIRKHKAKVFAIKNAGYIATKWNEDECDAYGINYFLTELESTEESHIRVQKKKQLIKRNKLKKAKEKNNVNNN